MWLPDSSKEKTESAVKEKDGDEVVLDSPGTRKVLINASWSLNETSPQF